MMVGMVVRQNCRPRTQTAPGSVPTHPRREGPRRGGSASLSTGCISSGDVVRRVDCVVGAAHHDGSVYRDTYEFVLRPESEHPNDLWHPDHTELDGMVLDEANRPVRPWLTVIADDHSRAVPGYTVFWVTPTRCRRRWRCGRRSGGNPTRHGRGIVECEPDGLRPGRLHHGVAGSVPGAFAQLCLL